MKRPTDPQEKEGGNKPSSKKAEASAKRSGAIWSAKEDITFLERLGAYRETVGKFPKNLGVFYDTVREHLDGDYTNGQMYNKVRGLKRKFSGTRDKIKNKSFRGFKNEYERSCYKMCKKVWGERKVDVEVGTEKAGNGGDATVENPRSAVHDRRPAVRRMIEMTEQYYQMIDQVCKENLRIFNAQLLETLSWLNSEI